MKINGTRKEVAALIETLSRLHLPCCQADTIDNSSGYLGKYHGFELNVEYTDEQQHDESREIIKETSYKIEVITTPDMDEIKLGRYRHFKGNEYEILHIAKHSETL